ncbi:MAG: hypothetical protein K0U12_06410, partial [Gammaproteobacteria bacterium]|nr:hypothetical protein [Gammaproteobacteria bacterium]
ENFRLSVAKDDSVSITLAGKVGQGVDAEDYDLGTILGLVQTLYDIICELKGLNELKLSPVLAKIEDGFMVIWPHFMSFLEGVTPEEFDRVATKQEANFWIRQYLQKPDGQAPLGGTMIDDYLEDPAASSSAIAAVESNRKTMECEQKKIRDKLSRVDLNKAVISKTDKTRIEATLMPDSKPLAQLFYGTQSVRGLIADYLADFVPNAKTSEVHHLAESLAKYPRGSSIYSLDLRDLTLIEFAAKQANQIISDMTEGEVFLNDKFSVKLIHGENFMFALELIELTGCLKITNYLKYAKEKCPDENIQSETNGPAISKVTITLGVPYPIFITIDRLAKPENEADFKAQNVKIAAYHQGLAARQRQQTSSRSLGSSAATFGGRSAAATDSGAATGGPKP